MVLGLFRRGFLYARALHALHQAGLSSDVGAERFMQLREAGLFERKAGLLSKAGNRRILELASLGALRPVDEFWVWKRPDVDPFFLELCERFGTDKSSMRHWRNSPGRSAHTYADVYSLLFADRRTEIRSLLEVGIFRGSSLRLWREYLPNAMIFGGDIDPNLLFSDDRIRTAVLDQTDPRSIAQAVATLEISTVDVVIDDGLHDFNANRTLFESTFQLLAAGGTYIIEDCTPDTLQRFREYFAERCISASSYSGFRPDGHKLADNSVIVVRKHQ